MKPISTTAPLPAAIRAELSAAMPPSAATLAPDDLVDEREAADILHAKVQTLRNWRWRGEGPRYRKIGARMVRYRRRDLEAFIEGTAGDGIAA